jgi:hypothetical protein
MRIVLGKPFETNGLTSRDRRALSKQLEEAVRANLVA